MIYWGFKEDEKVVLNCQENRRKLYKDMID